ncbi:MAG: 50S ribosomal protein L4 [Betaproteobacteria bacterium]|jgi:LSU ribosomal protein L4P|nr:50S ribosomal protein L4 [Betaproteobacteria bacterium]
MDLKLIDDKGEVTSTVSASDALFARDYNEPLVHQLVVAFQANARQGTRAQKGRSDIAKSTRKPWKQKGTGRARAGMASSPLWRGGGKIFPSSPDENFSHKVNRKMYRAGICTILSQLVREDRLLVVEDMELDSPKTRVFAGKLKGMQLDRVLIITDTLSENLYLSSRNLPNALVLEATEADPYNLVRFPKVLLTRSAIKKLEEELA